ncbi:MAG: hypothetical protein R3252_13905, partial [Robiginitalea sp.]|nr:hypothetical protein [Robiginitalea sp.]
LCTWAALWYDWNEARIKVQVARAWTSSKAMLSDLGQRFLRAGKARISRLSQYFNWGPGR